MTRVLVCGLCPLPFENTLRSFGPGIRTWQFAHSLAAAGHRVTLLAKEMPDSYGDDEALRRERRDGVEVERLREAEFYDPEELGSRIEALRPAALVGATLYGSHALALTRPRRPFWADQFGHVMAEAQAKAALEGENWPLPHFWKLLEPVLRRADKLSAVSNRQRYATIGELGVLGRLTHETCGYEFTALVPCAVVPAGNARVEPLLRGAAIPEDTFIVLWSGGYNVWSDVDTLFAGLEIALGADPRIHFVSTGGEIAGHDESSYRRFSESVAGSRLRDRYHLQGWVRAEDVPAYQTEADLGVLTEAPIYEGLLGSKNRIVQWMGVGLPVLYNRMGDLGSLLADDRLGLVFEPGDATAMAERILWAAGHPDDLARVRERARRYAAEQLSFEATTRELVAWAADPQRAPDARGPATGVCSRVRFELTTPPPEPGSLARGRVFAVVVHHRGRDMLERCLSSLLASTAVDLDVVVVANRCQEALPEVVEASPKVHVVASETALGFAAANNLGVAWARRHLGRPEFYYFVNNDTQSSPDALARLIAAAEQRPEVAMAGPTLLILGADEHYNSLGINVTEDGWGWDEAIGQSVFDYGPPPPPRPVLTVTGSALLIDAPVFHHVGGWTEIYEYYLEDVDLGIKVWKAHRQVLHVPEAVVRHRISATMTDGSERKEFLFRRNRLMLVLIHWPLGLLAKAWKRAVFGELLDRQRLDRAALRRAMLEVLKRLPALLRCRWRFRGNTDWRSFLKPPGSVPVITLPRLDPEAGKPARPPGDDPAPARRGAPAGDLSGPRA